jgi:hypothetical protein
MWVSVAGHGKLRSESPFIVNGEKVNKYPHPLSEGFLTIQATDSPIKLGRYSVCQSNSTEKIKVEFQGGNSWGGKPYNKKATYVFSSQAEVPEWEA